MEAEVREILRAALAVPDSGEPMGSRVRQRFASIGGVELEWPERVASPRAASLP